MQSVLFICTGNYYRSRFAEILFNRLAEKTKLEWRAGSRGLATEMCRGLPGVISPFTVEAIAKRELTCESVTRAPTQLSVEDLNRAHRVIALKQAEHRPLMIARYPGWEDRIEYWHVHDLDGASPEVALSEIETNVRDLVEELSSDVSEDQIYAIIGEEGFRRLVASFYAQIPHDPVIGPMYPKDDLVGAEQRMRDFLIQRFGGPTRYSQERGHPRLRMRHAPFAIDVNARNSWAGMMDRALDEAAFPANVDQVLRKFMRDTATFMVNR